MNTTKDRRYFATDNIASALENLTPAALDDLALLLQERFPASEAWCEPAPPRIRLLLSACECLRLGRKYRVGGDIALALRMERAFERVCRQYGQTGSAR